MTEPVETTPPATASTAPTQTPPTAGNEPPPWGEDFDAARAWHTIQTLREREKELSKQPRMTAEQQQQLNEYQALVEASKTDAQRKDEELARAQHAAETARAEAIRYKAAAMYGIAADHFDLLGTGTEEEITARAEKLSALLTAQAAIAPPTTTPPVTRPVEQMRPGATPGGTESEDDVIFARLFGAPK